MGLFAPPHDGFSIRDDLCKLLIENILEHFQQERQEVYLVG
jgi:hypothetical protein